MNIKLKKENKMILLTEITLIFRSYLMTHNPYRPYRFSAAMGLKFIESSSFDEGKLIKALREKHYSAENPSATIFRSLLFTLIRKADLENKESIAKGFPEEVLADYLWDVTGDEYVSKLKDLGIEV